VYRIPILHALPAPRLESPVPAETWTIVKLIDWTKDYFENARIDNPRLDAEILLAHVLHMTRIELYTRYATIPSKEELATFRELIKRRIAAEPVRYLTHATEFYSLPLHVDNRVLIPRPETEFLVDTVLASLPDRNLPVQIADLCTGSACIALALAAALPNARLYAVDNSADALEVARRNARDNQLTDRVRFFQGDLTAPLANAGLADALDVVVSNPPYVSESEFASLPREIREHEPRPALVAGPVGTEFHQRITRASREFLKHDGRLFMEIAETQGGPVSDILNGDGYRDVKLVRDYAGLHRVVSARK